MVQYDIDRHRRLLDSKGGSLGDAALSEGEALERLKEMVTRLYAIAGRQDFWALQSAYQVDSGSKCYSLLGSEGTLVNGPTWGSDGINLEDDQYIALPDDLLGIGAPDLSVIAVYNNTGTTPGVKESRIFTCGYDAFTEINLYSTSVADASMWSSCTWGYAKQVAPATTGVFSWLGMTHASTQVTGRFNDSNSSLIPIPSGRLNLPSSQPYKIGTTGSISFRGTAALLVTGKNIAFSQTQNNALYAAYKSSIGANLNLP